jgi:hypothetical protein
MKIDDTNNDQNKVGFFAGIHVGSSTAELVSVTDTTYSRIGFCGSGAADKKITGLCNGGAAISKLADWTETLNDYQHFKFVYDIGTGIEFFINGVSKGTLTTNMPVSDFSTTVQFAFKPCFVSHNLSSGTTPIMELLGVRCYWQNGV